MHLDADLDLRLERHLSAPPHAVWRAWTEADLLMRWFAPKPVRTEEATIEPRPGGRFYTRMVMPDGQEIAGDGCILAAEPDRRLVFTDALGPGWRPAAAPFMTAIVTMEPDGDGTAYRAVVLHADRAAREKHEDMGFAQGWGAAADQLEQVAATL
ncbi:SRPBCC family protein [Tranquillimonas alkanivorans]|uniref:Uncharacterized conserved protein YndB, AHSA1/START domain n=1 Tax=Tranquillimonas alkanivorans TaxID=441119 RepID=A0A1I5U1B1_9RHOB|nr:SRPBCC family protein [Tranquillimonas alkanivorans]SFP88657.1 Uncharacterized conserved protein YndB, AHSA1/START domain [Tranquillimonas alkanivorans]